MSEVAFDTGHPERPRLLLAVILALVAIGGAIDLAFDAPRRWLSAHVVTELTLMLVSLAAATVLARGWWHAERRLVRATRTLAHRDAERAAWRARAEGALSDLARAIDAQFAAWGLTPVEREVAFELLRGRSHKQIAALTGRSERTVRQHAVAVYGKSGLGGRAELAAFFLGAMGPIDVAREPPTAARSAAPPRAPETAAGR